MAPSRRGFRSPRSLRESVIYRNRRWPGRAVELAPFLIALVPLLAILVPALLGLDTDLAAGENEAALKLSLGGEGEGGSATAVKLLVVLTMLAVAPAIVLSMTSFTRMIVVFSLTRQALGIQQAPPNQILLGLALFLTWYVMAPTFEQVNELAVQPYQEGSMNEGEAVEAAMVPMKRFMLRNTRENDLGLFMRLSKMDRPKTRADVPARVLVPAFMISELKTAFQIGFLIYVPFLIIDIVVSVVLLAMGMMVLPPVVISLPFKLLLFVFVDGWNLLVGSMVQSFA
jgi:flagellar biosynthetic protein FliP